MCSNIRLLSWVKAARKPFENSKNGFVKNAGLTLLEIIIVVALLATLMTYLVSTLTGVSDSATEDQARLAMGQISQKLMIYRTHNRSFPTSEQGLDALIQNPGSSRRWRGPYIEESKLNDPWGNRFEYETDGRQYKLQSAGIDQQLGTEDDLFYPEEAGDNPEN